MNIVIGTITTDFEIYIDKDVGSHFSLLKHNGKRWRYRDGSVLWYEEVSEQEKFAVEQWLVEKGYEVKSQKTLKSIIDAYYYHGQDV